MRAYFKPRKAHPICLYLTAEEATRLMWLAQDPGLTKRNSLREDIPRIVGRAVMEMEATRER
ncbi:hypothetical protein ACFRCI_23585 [Streptomyces sp. NPDC056638]|uniref:hypothetical protein n=1 Tax=Streptomyces sp. NPDC056638 TaxID=3345887 RepID=UPI0036965DBD